MKHPRILYFVRGTLASIEAEKEAENYGSNLGFRNVNMIDEKEEPEECDGVAGLIPSQYKNHEHAEEVMKRFREDREATVEKMKQSKNQQSQPKEAATVEEVAEIISEVPDENYTSGGSPEVGYIEKLLEKNVTAIVRDQAYEIYKQKNSIPVWK